MFLIAILVALFFLVESDPTSIGGITLVGVEFAPNAIDFLRIAIPAVVAYLFSELWGLFVMAKQYRDLHDEVCNQIHQDLGSLRSALYPPDTVSLDAYSFLVIGGSSQMGELLNVVSALTIWFVAFFVPLAFLALSLRLLISDFGIGNVALIISLVVSLFFVIRTVGFALLSRTR
jgi:hypothetical protein